MNRLTLLMLAAFAGASTQAKVAEFLEDYSAQQAPAEIVAIAEQVADKVGFGDEYELVVPTKAGVQINPANKFITYGRNPINKKPLIVVNQEWFSQLPSQEQEFLLARCFMTFKESNMLPFRMVTGIFIILSILLLVFLFWLLGRVQVVAAKTWLRVLVAIGLTFAGELLILDKIDAKIVAYLSNKHDKRIIALVIEKTNNKEAAIASLERFDAAIKEELKKGQLYWKLLEDRFAGYAQELKK